MASHDPDVRRARRRWLRLDDVRGRSIVRVRLLFLLVGVRRRGLSRSGLVHDDDATGSATDREHNENQAGELHGTDYIVRAIGTRDM
jgi:hypothetical protein